MFNAFLKASGIDPAEVALLRHSGIGRLGVTPYDLWRRRDGSFDRYQQTQAPDKPLFERSRYWASFVCEPDRSTLFVGLYAARKGDRLEIDWECPIEGGAPGENKGRPSDLYHIAPLDLLSEHEGVLRIGYTGVWRAVGRYAAHNECTIIGAVDLTKVTAFAMSPEGEATWREQKRIERDSRMANAAFAQNGHDNGGKYLGLSGFPCAGGRLNITPPWP